MLARKPSRDKPKPDPENQLARRQGSLLPQNSPPKRRRTRSAAAVQCARQHARSGGGKTSQRRSPVVHSVFRRSGLPVRRRKRVDKMSWRRLSPLLLHVFLDVHLVVGGGIDRAIAIDRNADRRLHLGINRDRWRNEIHHLAVLHVSDPDTARAARIVIGGALV